MNVQDFGDAFDLDDDLIRHQKIYPIPAFDLNPVVDNRHSNFSLKRDSTLAKFVRETRLIRRLEQPRPERTVHSNRGTDQQPSDRIVAPKLVTPFRHAHPRNRKPRNRSPQSANAPTFTLLPPALP